MPDLVFPVQKLDQASLKLDLSNLCNMNCSYCFVNKSNPLKTNTSIAKKAIDWVFDEYAFDKKGCAVSLNLSSEPFFEFNKVKEIFDYIKWRDSHIYTENDFIDVNPWDLIGVLPQEMLGSFDTKEKNKKAGIDLLNEIIGERYLYKKLPCTEFQIRKMSSWLNEQIDKIEEFDLRNIHVFNCDCLVNVYKNKKGISPFFHPRNRYISFHTITNGTIVNDEIIEFVQDWNPGCIEVSLDGPEEVHNYNRKYKNGEGTYCDIIKNINSYKKAGIKVRALCTISEIFPYPFELIMFFKNIGVDEVKLSHIRNSSKNNDEYTEKLILSYKKLYDYLLIKIQESDFSLLSMIKSSSIFLSFIPLLTKNKKRKRCQFGSQIVVDNKGDLYPCDYFVGNLDWCKGSIFSESNKEVEFDVKIQEECVLCSLRYLCGGTCYSSSFEERGTYRKVNTQECMLNKKMALLNIDLFTRLVSKNIPLQLIADKMDYYYLNNDIVKFYDSVNSFSFQFNGSLISIKKQILREYTYNKNVKNNIKQIIIHNITQEDNNYKVIVDYVIVKENFNKENIKSGVFNIGNVSEYKIFGDFDRIPLYSKQMQLSNIQRGFVIKDSPCFMIDILELNKKNEKINIFGIQKIYGDTY